MFALLVSSKGFCTADEEIPGAGAAAASAKPIGSSKGFWAAAAEIPWVAAAVASAKPSEDIRTYMMPNEEGIPYPRDVAIQKEEKNRYTIYAARLPIVAYPSSGPLGGDLSDTLQKILRGLKPGEEVLIKKIQYYSTLYAICRCGFSIIDQLPTRDAAVFRKR